MNKHGMDIIDHRSAVLSVTDVLEATHIYCMAPRHHQAVIDLQRMAFKEEAPPAAQTTPATIVKIFDPEIPDPWHGTMETFRSCSEMLEKAVTKALKEDVAAA